MRPFFQKYLQHVLIGSSAALLVTGVVVTGHDPASATVAEAAAVVSRVADAAKIENSTAYLAEATRAPAASGTSASAVALEALGARVRKLSHPEALEKAFESYFAYRATNPGDVKKPYLYFVDYGLPSTAKRGYVFDMDKLEVIEGPFTVAHGRNSSSSMYGVPTRFSNALGSNATSLGLYLAQETYRFSGKSAGRRYTSVGLRMKGLSKGFNDNARVRGVVAHGAPYVTKNAAGRSEGCPAVTQELARKLLPKLANGGMVFLFAPNDNWLANDQWIGEAQRLASREVNGDADRVN